MEGEDYDAPSTADRLRSGQHICIPCNRAFASKQGFLLHEVKMHDRITTASLLIDATSQCKWCCTFYPTRQRAIAHLSGGFLRKHNGSCLSQMILYEFELMDTEAHKCARQEATTAEKANKKLGLSANYSSTYCRKSCGMRRPLIHGPLNREALASIALV
eukprot:TRINITY_DN36633_c0_g1_i1.p1 TRINITY_DN36633_c0_g1~~TRINITY_DN36633_c0_g1_i1.p1  ORF type:complete len:160 (+),score=21.91 TRINITY_DN36633_c0_g1_i1:2-481(+)